MLLILFYALYSNYLSYSMHCIPCIICYVLYSMHCILWTLFYALNYMHCILWIVCYILDSMHCVTYSAFYLTNWPIDIVIYRAAIAAKNIFWILYQTAIMKMLGGEGEGNELCVKLKDQQTPRPGWGLTTGQQRRS